MGCAGEVGGKALAQAMGKSAASDRIAYREFVQHLSWECTVRCSRQEHG